MGAMRQDFARSLGGRSDQLPAELNEVLRKDAEDRMRAGLLLTELARVNNIVVSEEDLNAQLEDLSRETGKAVQRLRVEYREKAKRDQLVAQVLEGKVLDLLLAKVTVTEKTAEAEAEAAKSE
jgi:trigger factor